MDKGTWLDQTGAQRRELNDKQVLMGQEESLPVMPVFSKARSAEFLCAHSLN